MKGVSAHINQCSLIVVIWDQKPKHCHTKSNDVFCFIIVTIKYNHMYIECQIQCSFISNTILFNPIISNPIKHIVDGISTIYCLLNYFILDMKIMKMEHWKVNKFAQTMNKTTLSFKHMCKDNKCMIYDSLN